jgi:hypothetical protein
MLGGSVAVTQERSISTPPSTTSPTSTTRQTTSMPSSKATRRRPAPSEPRETRPRRWVSDFHASSLCIVDTVASIRNVACPQARLTVDVQIEHRHRRLELRTSLRSTALHDRLLQSGGDAARRPCKDASGQVHCVRRLLHVTHPASGCSRHVAPQKHGTGLPGTGFDVGLAAAHFLGRRRGDE